MIVHDFGDDRNAAERYVRALCRSSHYRRDGRPPLPRCDSPRWTDRDVEQSLGRHPECPCPSREEPDDACPYVTRDHVPVERIGDDGPYIVRVTELDARLRGEQVDVDGVRVTITDVGGRPLLPGEIPRPAHAGGPGRPGVERGNGR